MGGDNSEVKYLVRFENEIARLVIFGKANYLNCRKIGDFFSRVLARGCNRIVVDCAECAGMDSTFLGTMAGAAIKLRKSGGTFEIVNLSGRNLEIVENLGLGKIIKISCAEKGESPSLAGEGESISPEAADAKKMLSAHKSLVEADAANLEKFEDVISFLEKEAEI